MEFNEQGLPLPGWDLDYWLGTHFSLGVAPSVSPGSVPKFSTTHLFFRVMEEAKSQGYFEFFQHTKLVVDWHNDLEHTLSAVRVRVPWQDTIEKTFAWGVCAALWKAE